jgi:hypothetical protein
MSPPFQQRARSGIKRLDEMNGSKIFDKVLIFIYKLSRTSGNNNDWRKGCPVNSAESTRVFAVTILKATDLTTVALQDRSFDKPLSS